MCSWILALALQFVSHLTCPRKLDKNFQSSHHNLSGFFVQKKQNEDTNELYPQRIYLLLYTAPESKFNIPKQKQPASNILKRSHNITTFLIVLSKSTTVYKQMQFNNTL